MWSAGSTGQVVEQHAQQAGPIAELSPVLGPLQNLSFFGTLGKWARVTNPTVAYVAYKF
jgi:hypothetical protein